MIGAGVFAAFGPAAHAAGSGLLLGLLLAAGIAYCNATASAQLAAVYPVSGGTYIYGRERLGHWWGFLAGWGFVVGKTASCAAMALTFASYAVPGPSWVRRLVAVAAVLALVSLNYRGVTKTAATTRVLVSLTLTALAVLVVGIALAPQTDSSHFDSWSALGSGGGYGILQSAGLLFFAFAGYARIATAAASQPATQRRWPRPLNVVGVLGCLLLVAALPTASVLAGLAMFALGTMGRLIVLRRRRWHRSGGPA
jgi:APA family basic amino acid/polyamine antiporter